MRRTQTQIFLDWLCKRNEKANLDDYNTLTVKEREKLILEVGINFNIFSWSSGDGYQAIASLMDLVVAWEVAGIAVSLESLIDAGFKIKKRNP